MRNKSIALIMLLCYYLSGQVQFQKLYGDTISEDGFSICRSKHEVSYVYTGRSQTPGNSNLILTKVNAFGDTIWTKTLNSIGLTQGRHIISTLDSGYAVIGTRDISGAQDAILIKLNKQGQVQWGSSFDYLGNSESGRSIIQTADGGYFLLGNSTISNVSSPFLIRLGKSGNFKWSKIYASNYDRLAEAFTLTTDGSIAITGSTRDSLTSAMNPLVFKADTSNGNFIWARMSIGNNGSVFYSVLENNANELVLGGGTQDHNVIGIRSAIFSKFNLSGNMITFRSYNDCHSMLGYKIVQNISGGYAMTGFIMPCTATSLNAFILKLNNNGSIASHAVYGNTLSVMTGWDLVEEGNSGFVITGSLNNTLTIPASSDAFVMRTNSVGISGCNEYSVNLQSAIFTPTFFPTSFYYLSGLNSNTFLPTFKKGLKISTLCYNVVSNSINNLEINNNEPYFYPNPFQGVVKTNVLMNDIDNLQIIDSQGKVINEVLIEPSGAQTQIKFKNEEGLLSGIYLFKLILRSGEVIAFKLVH